jgi:hypothetical protein
MAAGREQAFGCPAKSHRLSSRLKRSVRPGPTHWLVQEDKWVPDSAARFRDDKRWDFAERQPPEKKKTRFGEARLSLLYATLLVRYKLAFGRFGKP